MKRGKHSWWSGSPAKKCGVIKAGDRKRGKQTIQGDRGPIAVFISSTYKGGK